MALSFGSAGYVQGGQIAEGHGGADGSARPGVGMPHHRRAHIARRVQTVDHTAVVTQRATVHVGANAALGAQVARNHLGGVVRRMAYLAEVRVRLVRRVAVVPVVSALAAVIVGVDTRAREAVETLDRRVELLDRQAGFGGQLVERIRLNDHTGLRPLTRNALSWLQSSENVTVAVLLVEHQPRRDVLARPRSLTELAAVHVMARFDVRHGFVHESLAGHVDDDRAGRVALRQREPRCTDQRDGWPPPGVLHDVECGAELFGGENSVAGVGLRAHRPLGGDRRTLVLDPHLLVVLEPAATANHCLSGSNQLWLSGFRLFGVANIYAADCPVLDVEVGQRGVELYRDTGLLETDPERRDQSASHADQILTGHLRPHRACTDLEAAEHAARMTLELVQSHVVLLHHNDVERDLAVRRFQSGQIGTELPCVERLRLDGTAAGPTTRGFGVVVGVLRPPAHL